ncbi:hypothetical protein ABTE52_22150, partial [Acinetobacter baumannii]
MVVPILKLDDAKKEFKIGETAGRENTPLSKFRGKPKNNLEVGLKVWGPITLDDVESFSFRSEPPSGDFLLRLHEKGV